MKTAWNCFWIIALSLLATGCDSARETTPGAVTHFEHAQSLDVSAHEYRINPPDKLAIRATTIPELKDFVTTVRPDGRISLNLLGEIYVAGKTPEEISKQLTEAATKYYHNPDIRVEVAEYNSKFYYLFGEVGAAGKKPYTGRDTVVSALAEAGFTQDSWPQQVYLNRKVGPNPNDAVTVVVDMKHMYMTGDVTQNYLIKEDDIISVNRSPLAQWRDTLDKAAGPLGSGAGAASAVRSVGPTGGAR